MGETIPLKWLKFEQEISKLVQKGTSFDKDLQTVQDISDVNIIILIYLFIKHVLFILMYLYKCKMHVSRVESLSFQLSNYRQFVVMLILDFPLHNL
jgi:hypothetical protein